MLEQGFRERDFTERHGTVVGLSILICIHVQACKGVLEGRGQCQAGAGGAGSRAAG